MIKILTILLYSTVNHIYPTMPLELKDDKETTKEKYKINRLYRESMLLKNSKKYDESKAKLKDIINIDPRQIDAHLLLAELEYLNKNWKEAITKSKDYLKIIDFKDKQNFLDISWAFFLIGEVNNSIDYITEFLKNNKELLRENIFIAIDALFKKSFYHFINNENLMFNTILISIFQLESNDDSLFTIFLNTLDIIQCIPFYYFNRDKIKDLTIQVNTLKSIKNKINTNLT